MDPQVQQNKPWYSKYFDASWRYIEDTYLHYFGENRTSYGTKDSLRKLEVETGAKDVDGVQRTVGDTAGGLFKPGHIGGAVGDALDGNVLKGNV